jgi:NADPH:quinone reductase-like Zn-dependent oxidoreductase
MLARRETVKASRVHSFGPPSVISFEESARPVPAEDEVVVQVAAAGVGPWDAWIREGKSALPQPLPLTLGADLSGKIVELGSKVRGFELGQSVFGVTNPRFVGAYAEYAAASAAMIAPRPVHSSDIEAGGVPVVAVTALQMLFDHGGLTAGQRVLIHGAGGAVGVFAVQLALAAEAQVIGTDLTEGAGYARRLGATQAVDISSDRFEDHVAPVDLIIDLVGGDVQKRSFSVLKPGGALVSSVAKPDPELSARRGLRAKFVLVDVTTAALTRIANQVDAGKLKPRAGPVLPLAEAEKWCSR